MQVIQLKHAQIVPHRHTHGHLPNIGYAFYLLSMTLIELSNCDPTKTKVRDLIVRLIKRRFSYERTPSYLSTCRKYIS